MALMGGGGSSDAGLDALANLAAALSDPAKLKAAIDQYKAAETAAKEAQAAAAKAQADANVAISKMATERAALDAKAAQVTAIAEANTARTKHLDSVEAGLKAREAKLTADRTALMAEVDAAKASLAASAKAEATRQANTDAALNDRAVRLKAGEDALAEDRAKYQQDKAALDARAAKIAQAVA